MRAPKHLVRAEAISSAFMLRTTLASLVAVRSSSYINLESLGAYDGSSEPGNDESNKNISVAGS
jgi:hypothetical protein